MKKFFAAISVALLVFGVVGVGERDSGKRAMAYPEEKCTVLNIRDAPADRYSASAAGTTDGYGSVTFDCQGESGYACRMCVRVRVYQDINKHIGIPNWAESQPSPYVGFYSIFLDGKVVAPSEWVDYEGLCNVNNQVLAPHAVVTGLRTPGHYKIQIEYANKDINGNCPAQAIYGSWWSWWFP